VSGTDQTERTAAGTYFSSAQVIGRLAPRKVQAPETPFEKMPKPPASSKLRATLVVSLEVGEKFASLQ
jgi:hypothetical protein